jgi:hypothetical protein
VKLPWTINIHFKEKKRGQEGKIGLSLALGASGRGSRHKER